jgi:hypothetical protein
MPDPLKFFGAIGLGLVVFMGIIIALCNWGESNQCANAAAVMGVPYAYGINTPCMVQVDGKWQLLKYPRRD